MKGISLNISELIEKIGNLEGLDVSPGVRLEKCTTIGIGGPCAAMVEAGDATALAACLKALHGEGRHAVDVFVLGGGSNILASDSGFDGVILKLGNGFEKLEDRGGDIVVGAAYPLKDLALRGVREGWGGLECFVGLPGTVGGGVRMNAGAWGKQIWDIVRRVHMIDMTGHKKAVSRSEVSPVYRHGGLAGDIIVTSVEFRCERESPLELKNRSKQLMVSRKKNQAVRLPSFGSVFKNPEGFHAGKLIDSLGLKGRAVGNAMIPEEHANFIVNKGGASSNDVLTLMSIMKKGVREEYGIELEPEVIFLGMTDAELEGIL